MFGVLREAVERLETGRRQKLLRLLAGRAMSEAQLRRQFRVPLSVGWHLRDLHALGLVAYNRRADRYHLVRPALEELAAFCTQLEEHAEASSQAVPEAKRREPIRGRARSTRPAEALTAQ